MCANFRKAFENKNMSVPDSILKQLEKDLPDGFKYKSLNDGVCIMIPDDINKIIKKESFILPKELEDKNIKEILQYSYSSQEPLKLKESIPLDDSILEIKDMLKFPFRAEEVSLGEIVLVPSPFHEFDLELSGNGVKKNIIIKRQKSKNTNKIIFKRVDSIDLDFSYILDLESSNINFSININFEKCTSIEELIVNLKLYKSFGDGTIKIFGIDIAKKGHDFKVNIDKNALDSIIDFYEKLLKITKLINIDIKPKSSIDNEDIYCVEELYRTLIDNKPYKEYIQMNKLNITMLNELDKDLILNKKGFAFHSSCKYECDILGYSIELPSIIAIYNIIVTDVKMLNSDKYIDYELDTSNIKGKKIYKSCMHFKDKDAYSNYIKSIDNIIEELKDAEEINL